MAFQRFAAVQFAAPALTLGESNIAGSSGQAIASDSTILAFSVTLPSIAVPFKTSDAGIATIASRGDHRHNITGDRRWFAFIRLFSH